MYEAEGVMEVSKDFKIPEIMSLGGLFGSIRKLAEDTFDSVRFDYIGIPRDADGNALDYLGFTAVMNEHQTSFAIYRTATDRLTIDVIPEVNHSCEACNRMWYSVRDIIYRYINSWERYIRRHRFAAR